MPTRIARRTQSKPMYVVGEEFSKWSRSEPSDLPEPQGLCEPGVLHHFIACDLTRVLAHANSR